MLLRWDSLHVPGAQDRLPQTLAESARERLPGAPQRVPQDGCGGGETGPALVYGQSKTPEARARAPAPAPARA